MRSIPCIPGVRAFYWSGSVFGARCSALGVDPVPDPGSQVPDTWCSYWYQVSGIRAIFILHHAYPVCGFSGGRARSSVLGVRPSASDWLRCRVPSPRCQIAGTRYLVPGTWYRIPGTGLAPKAGYRAPSTENAHTGYASCILHPYLQMHYNCGRVTGSAGPCRSFIGDGGSAGISAPLAVKRGRGGAAPGFKPGSRESVGHG
jgi:hypothetical protein